MRSNNICKNKKVIMNINLHKVTKRYSENLIFKKFSYKFYDKKSYIITGSNGSGKSTLMKIISGYLSPNSGIIEYIDNSNNNKAISKEFFFKYNAIAAPYVEIIEEFTLKEFLKFHFNFKKDNSNLSINNMINFLELKKESNVQIKNFSSGIKQKIKIGLVFLANSPVILLDEPTSNMDKKNINWYIENIKKIINKKLIIMFSNQPNEYIFFKKKEIIKLN